MSGGQFYLIDQKDQKHKAVFGEFTSKDLWLEWLEPKNQLKSQLNLIFHLTKDVSYKIVIRPQKEQSTVDTASICLTNC